MSGASDAGCWRRGETPRFSASATSWFVRLFFSFLSRLTTHATTQEFACDEDPMLSTWVYQYVHFSDRCGACEGCVHGGNCFDSTPLPPSPFLAPSPPWVPRLSFDLTFLENDGQIACISVQLVKGQPRLMRWADGGMSVVFTYGGSCLLYTSPSPRDYAASRMPSSA